MGTVEEVTSILREQFGWTEFCAPAPDPTTLQLEVDSDFTVANKMDSAVRSIVAAGIPWNVKPEDGYEWACRQKFTINQKYWDLNTSLALGQQTELPVDTIGKAASPTQWWNAQEILRNRLGELLCEQAEFNRRKSYANGTPPLEWTEWNGGALIWQLAVREGYMPVGADKFDPAYLQTFPKLKDVRGLSATKWMENLAAADQGKPWPWASDKQAAK